MPFRAIRPLPAAAVALALQAGAMEVATTETSGNNVQFQVVKDDPNLIADKIVGLNGAVGHFSGAEGLKAGVGAHVLWGLMPKLQIQGDFLWYYLGIKDAGGFNYDLEGGAAFTLMGSTKTEEVKVILKFSEEKTATTKTTSATFVPSQATALTQYKVRGGVFSKRSGAVVDDKPDTDPTVFMSHGVYAGGEWVKQICLFTDINGKKGVTSGLTRIWADVMVLPATSFEEQGSADDPGIFGWRAGFAGYLNPNKRNHPEYGKLDMRNMWPTLFSKIEAGQRGGEGWFFQMGVGLLLFRNQ